MVLNPLDMTGRTILVTGASSGLGRETAKLLSRLGAKVILCGRNEERLREALGDLEGDGHAVEPCDFADSDTIPAWLKDVSTRHGLLHGLVHSAGLHSSTPLRWLETEKIEAVLRVNLVAAMNLVKGFRRKGVCGQQASVVLLASVVGLVGQPAISAYAASKGGLIAFSRSAALELAAENIRINCVAPGCVRSGMGQQLGDILNAEQLAAVEKMHPLGLGEATDVANAVAFLLAPASRWITGTTLVVDGGYTAQ